MVRRRRSLNAYIDQHQVLPLLGIMSHEGSIPLVTGCPLCHGHRLIIFDDTRFGGNWHHCSDCHSTGDMISLAARHWGSDVYATVRKLADAGCTIPEEHTAEARIANYARWLPGIQENCRKLQKDACDAIHLGQVKVNYVLQQLGVPADQMKTYWPKRMGRFMGGADRARVYQTFFKPDDNWYKMQRGRRFFKGKGWRDVITIPFHTLPGQCSGWLFVGRQARQDVDYAFHIVDTETTDNVLVESGLCMYDVLDTETARRDKFGDTIFVFNDPVHALKLQARHLRDSTLPLPVVGTYNARVPRQTCVRELIAHDIWRTRPDKKFIFWGPVLSADLFDMASRANGHVCVSKTPMYLGRKPPYVWLSLIQKNATHWTAALESYLRVLPEDKAVALLSSLRIAPEQMQQFKVKCADDVKQLLDRVRHRVQALSTATVNGKTIFESEQGWYVSGKRPECITNTIIRIEKVLCMADDPDADVYYSGRILCDGEAFEFQEPMARIEKNPGAWLKKKMLTESGKFVVVKQGWNKFLLDIARQFHEPQVIREDGRFGWKAHESCFALPRFSVHVGGEVVNEPAHIVDEWAPGVSLEAGDVPDLSLLLRDTPSNRLFWAATICIASNVLAPAVGQRPAGLGLIGHGALMIGRATARASGCKELAVGGATPQHSSRVAARIEGILSRHNWPLIINFDRHGSSKTLLGAWYNGDYIRNGIVHLTWERSRLVATLDAWRFIHEDQPIEPGPEISLYGPHVLPAWLSRVCRNKMQIGLGQEFSHLVMHDLADMMRNVGDPQVIYEGARLINDGSYAETDRAAQLVELLYRFIEDGALKFVHATDAHKFNTPKAILITGDARAPGVFLAREALDRILVKRGITLPDPGKITDALQTGNALDCECEYNGEVGWFIIESWWSRQIERCRTSQRQLAVIGGER